ncbi:MAG: hypothetical protein HFG27_07170 [Provencibacterium sp.]|jgi:hypothetical protein|nr:hypothetical protein [Provencibacterium sp.]
MKRKNNVRLYNLLLPLWALLLLPQLWLIVIPGNFLIDSAVLLLSLHFLHIEGKKEIYKRSILKIFLFGFLSDLAGSLLLFLSQLVDAYFGDWWYQNMTNAIAMNPFENIFAFLYVLAALLLSGGCIYLLNRRFSFRKTSLSPALQKRLSLLLAVFTAPYLFFFPSNLIYRSLF